MKVTEELLEKNGYKRISYPYSDPDSHTHFQKRFRDENENTKYFVEVDHLHVRDISSYEFRIQLSPEGYDTIDVSTTQWFNNDQRYSEMTLEKVEELFEKLFRYLKCEMYD